jgi:D-alanine-D-alanine ligase
MERVILLFGGTSEERLVSVASAQNVASRFARPNCALWFIDPAGAVREASLPELLAHERPFQEPFRPQRPAFAPSIRAAAKELAHGTAFIALHGTEGEDGSLQELFESRGIRFTGAGFALTKSRPRPKLRAPACALWSKFRLRRTRSKSRARRSLGFFPAAATVSS